MTIVATLGSACGRGEPANDSTSPIIRTYYIAVDEVEWDYAPTGIDQLTAEPFEGVAVQVAESGPDRIGRVYRKALYREYTDATFTELKARPAEWEHLGFLEPLLRGKSQQATVQRTQLREILGEKPAREITLK